MFNIFKKNRKKSTCYACGNIDKKVELDTYGDDFTKSLLELFEVFKSERKVDQDYKRFKVLNTGEYGFKISETSLGLSSRTVYTVYLVKDALSGCSYLLRLERSLYHRHRAQFISNLTPEVLEGNLRSLESGFLVPFDEGVFDQGIRILSEIDTLRGEITSFDMFPQKAKSALNEAVTEYIKRLERVQDFKNRIEIRKKENHRLAEFRKKHGLQ